MLYILVIRQALVDGFESSRESEFPPTLSSSSVRAISESQTIIC